MIQSGTGVSGGIWSRCPLNPHYLRLDSNSGYYTLDPGFNICFPFGFVFSLSFLLCTSGWLSGLIWSVSINTNRLVNERARLTHHIIGQLSPWHFTKQHLSLLSLRNSCSDPVAQPQTVALVLGIGLRHDCQLFPTSSVKVSTGSDSTLVALGVMTEVILYVLILELSVHSA